MPPPSLLPPRPCGMMRFFLRKIWNQSLWFWKPCNPLKSHKTAKEFFGKAWSKTHQIWKCLAKSLEPSRARRPVAGAATRSCAAPLRPSLPRLRPAPRRERGFRGHHFGIFAVQVRERQRVHVFGGPKPTPEIADVHRPTGIADQKHAISDVGRGADRRLD